MAEDTQERDPKFSAVEIIGVTIALLVLDVLDWFQAGVPGSDLAAFPSLQAYMWKKGIGQIFTLVANLLELIPFADYLPLRTTAFLIIAWADRHQDGWFAKIIVKAEKVEALAKGEVTEGAGSFAASGKKGMTGPRTGTAAGREEVKTTEKVGGRATAEKKEKGEGTIESQKRRSGGGAEGGVRHVGEGELEEDEPEEEEQKHLSPEQKELEEILSGNYVGRVLRENLDAEELLSQIGGQALGARPLKFDPDRAIQAKPASQPKTNDNRYNKEVDLRDAA
jgi:hypothetical protein